MPTSSPRTTARGGGFTIPATQHPPKPYDSPMHKIAALIGAALLAVGLTIGLIPVTSSGVNCGSVLIASDDSFTADLADTLGGGPNSLPGSPLPTHQADCDSLRSILRIPVIAVGLIGAGLLIGVAMTRPIPKPAPKP